MVKVETSRKISAQVMGKNFKILKIDFVTSSLENSNDDIPFHTLGYIILKFKSIFKMINIIR